MPLTNKQLMELGQRVLDSNLQKWIDEQMWQAFDWEPLHPKATQDSTN